MQRTVSRRKGKGQALAEFAVTLPILLILMFGVIEFGRIFQAWVTLQNAARAAARYATTGQFDESRYPVNTNGQNDENSVVPCVTGNQRGSTFSWQPDPGSSLTVNMYTGGKESLYATWYQGEDCDPANLVHQDRREDLARILSIFDEARLGAAGLAISNANSGLSPATMGQPPANAAAWVAGGNSATFLNSVPWYAVWKRPQPGDDPDGGGAASPVPFLYHQGYRTPSYFDVMICSDRNPEFQNLGVDRLTTTYGADGCRDDERFCTVLDNRNATNLDDYAPACILQENRGSTAGGGFNNFGVPWIDPGADADPITIVVTFNHPLVTPLGLSPYVQLQARRTAVNEAFRQARSVAAIPAIDPGSGGGSPGVTGTPPTSTNPPPASATATVSVTPNVQIASATPAYSCDSVRIATDADGRQNVSLNGQDLVIEIENNNFQNIRLERVELIFPFLQDYDGFVPGNMKLNFTTWWMNGNNVYAQPTNTRQVGTYLSGVDPIIPARSTGLLTITFVNGPVNLSDVSSLGDYDGTLIIFQNAGGGPDCVRAIEADSNNTPPPNATLPTATHTPTPACAPGLMEVQFREFQSFGVVRVEITNRRNVPARLTEFLINWVQYDVAGSNLRLARVRAGGSNVDDSSAVTIWQANAPQDNSAGTRSGNPAPAGTEGTWLVSYNFPPFQSTNLWLDFDGVGSVPLNGFYPAGLADFNGSRFEFLIAACGTGGSGSGNPAYEDITPNIQASNTPSNTPRPSPTNPDWTATFTSTPVTPPPSRTPAPTNTALPTNPPPPTSGPPTWTPIFGGGVQ